MAAQVYRYKAKEGNLIVLNQLERPPVGATRIGTTEAVKTFGPVAVVQRDTQARQRFRKTHKAT